MKDKTVEKYLAQMLEGYERNLPQLDEALGQIAVQISQMKEQKESMLEGISELKDLLGLDEESETPHLTLLNSLSGEEIEEEEEVVEDGSD